MGEAIRPSLKDFEQAAVKSAYRVQALSPPVRAWWSFPPALLL